MSRSMELFIQEFTSKLGAITGFSYIFRVTPLALDPTEYRKSGIFPFMS